MKTKLPSSWFNRLLCQ